MILLVAIGFVKRLMRKSEIQPLISLVFRGPKIRLLLFRTHAPPNPLAFFIRVQVVHFRSHEYQKVPRTYRNQDLVASSIQRLIIIPVDILANDTASLHRHIVQRRSNSACAYGAGVARRDRDENGVDVWMAYKERRKYPSRPG
jgi:hypothetical protein